MVLITYVDNIMGNIWTNQSSLILMRLIPTDSHSNCMNESVSIKLRSRSCGKEDKDNRLELIRLFYLQNILA